MGGVFAFGKGRTRVKNATARGRRSLQDFADGLAERGGDGEHGERRAGKQPAEAGPDDVERVGIEPGAVEQAGFEAGEGEQGRVEGGDQRVRAEAGEREQEQGLGGVAQEHEGRGRAEAAQEGDDVSVLSILQAGDGAEDEREHEAAGDPGGGLGAAAGLVEATDFIEEDLGALQLGGVAALDQQEGAHGVGEGAHGVGAGGVGEQEAEFQVSVPEPVGGLVVG